GLVMGRTAARANPQPPYALTSNPVLYQLYVAEAPSIPSGSRRDARSRRPPRAMIDERRYSAYASMSCPAGSVAGQTSSGPTSATSRAVALMVSPGRPTPHRITLALVVRGIPRRTSPGL